MRSMRPGFPTSLIYPVGSVQKESEIESLASRSLSAALQLRFAQNDIGTWLLVLLGDISKHLGVVLAGIFFLSFSEWDIVGDAADASITLGILLSHLEWDTDWHRRDAAGPIELDMPCPNILFGFLHRISRVPSGLRRYARSGSKR